MGKLLTATDFKNTYGKAPLFLNWAYPYYNLNLDSASDSLLVNASSYFNNPSAYQDTSGAHAQTRTDTLLARPTLITINVASLADGVTSSSYCPSGFNFLRSNIGASDRYLALNGTYTNSNSRVGLFDANYVFNYLDGLMCKSTNGTITNLYTISLFMDACELYPDYGYVLISGTLWLGTITYAIQYHEDATNMWEYLGSDYPDNIYSSLINYGYKAAIHSNCLYTGAFINSSNLNTTYDMGLSSLSYTWCFDRRLSTSNLTSGHIYKFDNMISSGDYNLLGLEIIISSLYAPSFNYYDNNNNVQTYSSQTYTFTTPFLTPGIGYFEMSNSDPNTDNTFNIAPRVIDRGTINEVVAIRKKNAAGDYEYVIGNRHIYSLFYVIPLLGGNASNKFIPTSLLGFTNNEIHCILHHYGNASSFSEL